MDVDGGSTVTDREGSPEAMAVALDSLDQIVTRLLARFDVPPKEALKLLRAEARAFLEESRT